MIHWRVKMIKNIAFFVIILFLLNGCNRDVSENLRKTNRRSELIISDVKNEEEFLDKGDTAYVIPDKRKVDFWDSQFGYQITGKNELYIADVQDGQDGETQQPGIQYGNANKTETDKDIIEVNIPEEVFYKNVLYRIVGVGYNSFTGCRDVKSVNMPDTIRYIEEFAFKDCFKIESIKWSTNIECIGGNAFSFDKIDKVKFPDSLVLLGEGVFRYSNITEITLPKNLEVLGDILFIGCVDLKRVIILCDEVEIGQQLFQDCENLKEVYVPKESLEYYKKCFLDHDFEVLSLK